MSDSSPGNQWPVKVLTKQFKAVCDGKHQFTEGATSERAEVYTSVQPGAVANKQNFLSQSERPFFPALA